MNLERDGYYFFFFCNKIAYVNVSSAVKEEIPDNEQEKGNEREQLEPASEEAEVHLPHFFWNLFP